MYNITRDLLSIGIYIRANKCRLKYIFASKVIIQECFESFKAIPVFYLYLNTEIKFLSPL
jgi:hypothetical protein